jgi:hypothetical protein
MDNTSLAASMVCVGFGWLCWFWGWFTIDHQNVKDSNPWPPLTQKNAKIRTQDHALHHHWPPKRQRKIRTHDHALHHWPPKRQKFEPKTIDLHHIDLIFTIDHILPHWPPSKDSNPRPCTTPPLTLKTTKILTQDLMHSPACTTPLLTMKEHSEVVHRG